jgi:peptidyl-tRNA hydrolase
MAAAATGAAALCADQRSEPGGDWYEAIRDYCRGHIRKVTRRARGAHWAAAQDLPGITVDIGGTQVRALLPGLVSELDPRIGRLQVGGTDVAPDDPAVVAADEIPGALQVWLAPTPVMTLGKAMAQAGHAGMIAVALLAEADPGVLSAWAAAGLPAVARRATAEEWSALTARSADPGGFSVTGTLAVRDAGFTEVEPGTVTVIARAPGMDR